MNNKRSSFVRLRRWLRGYEPQKKAASDRRTPRTQVRAELFTRLREACEQKTGEGTR
jgi:hypothetical protein